MAFLNNPGLINLISHNMQTPAEKKNYKLLKSCWRLIGFKGCLVVETVFSKEIYQTSKYEIKLQCQAEAQRVKRIHFPNSTPYADVSSW